MSNFSSYKIIATIEHIFVLLNIYFVLLNIYFVLLNINYFVEYCYKYSTISISLIQNLLVLCQ